MVEGETLGDHGLHQQIRDGGEIVGLDVEVAIVAVLLLGLVEPRLGVEGFGLDENRKRKF